MYRTLFHSVGLLALSAVFLTSCSEQKKNEEIPPVRVKTITITPQKVSLSQTYSGTIEEESGTALSFKVPGTLKSLYVTEGQKVAKGQLIGELDAQSLQNAYEISKAALATAQDTYDRMAKLHAASAVPEMKWVEVENALSAAKSSTQIALNNLNDTKLYAPFSGYIANKNVEVGATVIPATPVVKLVKIESVKINISVSENEIAQITKGGKASFSVPALGDEVFSCSVTEKGISASPLTRTYPVKFTTTNPDHKLLPGMICNLRLEGANEAEAFIVPVSAVMLDAVNRYFVWIDNGGKAERRNVTTSAFAADGVVINSGLLQGDKVIVEGQQKVSENSPITPVN